MRLQVLCLFAALSVQSAISQAPPPQQPGYVILDKHCKEVHPGDVVSYSLTIEGLANAQAVYADLQMRPNHELPLHAKGLPVPDFRNLGGGGLGQVDAAGQNTYSFSFVVPKEIFGGRYRGVEVLVKADAPVTTADASRYMDVSHHTNKQVHSFCLNVVSPYGVQSREDRPEVTNFQSGLIVPKQ